MNRTVKELRLLCKEKRIKNYTKMNKKELQKELKVVEKELKVVEKKEDTEEKKETKKIVKIGIHVFKGNDMANSIKEAKSNCPLNAVQIFTHGPRSTRQVNHDYKAIKKETSDIHLYVHSSYPTNPWNGKPEIIKHTVDQFVSSSLLGAKGVVLHIPKLNPQEVSETVKKLVKELNKKNILKDQRVILEMKAVKQHPTESYESPEKINRLIETLRKDGMSESQVGICIDTAHIYAGKADIHTHTQGVEYFKKLKYPEWIALFHINGNVYDVKKRAGDKHAVPLDEEDKVWKGLKYKDSGCRAFIEYAVSKKIDLIVEIKDHHTYKHINDFVDKIT